MSFGKTPLLSSSQIDYALIVDSFLIAAVDVFILISGYFSIKFKASGFVKLFSVVSFFAMIGFCNYLYTNGLQGGVIGSIGRIAPVSYTHIMLSMLWLSNTTCLSSTAATLVHVTVS